MSGISNTAPFPGFSIALTAVGMLTVPFCKMAPLLTILMSTVGVSMGILDTGKARIHNTITRINGCETLTYHMALYCFTRQRTESPPGS